jgi:hypothetical protein
MFAGVKSDQNTHCCRVELVHRISSIKTVFV